MESLWGYLKTNMTYSNAKYLSMRMLIFAAVMAVLMLLCGGFGRYLEIEELEIMALGCWAGFALCLGLFLYFQNCVEKANMQRLLELFDRMRTGR